MIIGIVPDPLEHPDWPKIEALLQPAARQGGVPVLEEHEAVWAVYAPDLKAAATARLTVNNEGEIILCGGRESQLWAQALADRICDWFRDEGMRVAMIYGRRGWGRVLGWQVTGEGNGIVAFKRVLQ